ILITLCPAYRTYGAPDFFRNLSQPSRAGLISAAPPALIQRKPRTSFLLGLSPLPNRFPLGLQMTARSSRSSRRSPGNSDTIWTDGYLTDSALDCRCGPEIPLHFNFIPFCGERGSRVNKRQPVGVSSGALRARRQTQVAYPL